MKPKINAFTYSFSCPCGQHKTTHYNWRPCSNKECQSFEIRCPECKDKYKFIFNPITKQGYYLDPETNELLYWTYAQEFRLTEIPNTYYPNEYEYTLSQLEELEKRATLGNLLTRLLKSDKPNYIVELKNSF